jgi:hypothetical protein
VAYPNYEAAAHLGLELALDNQAVSGIKVVLAILASKARRTKPDHMAFIVS